MSFGWPMGAQGGFGRQPWMGARAAQEGLAYGPGGVAAGGMPMAVPQPPPQMPMGPPQPPPGMMQGQGGPVPPGGRPPMAQGPAPGVVESSQALHPDMGKGPPAPPPGAPGAPGAPAPGQGGMSPAMLGMGLLGAGLLDRSRGGARGGGLLDSVGGMQGLLAMQQMMRPGMFGGQGPPTAPGQPQPMGPGGLLGGRV